MRRLSLGATLAATLLALLCAVQVLALMRASAAWTPAGIAVTLAPGESAMVGRQELGAPRAAPRQLVLRRDRDGDWLLRNAEPQQAVVLRRGDARQRSSDLALEAGQRIQAGARRLQVVSAEAGRVTLHDGEQTWTYDGATVLRDGQPQPACPDAGLSARAVAAWNRWLPQGASLARPLSLGGLLYCGNRIAAAAIEPGDALLLRQEDGRIALSARGAQPVLVSQGAGWIDAAQRELPLADVDGFAVGRTLFTIARDGATLRLSPSRQVALSASPANQLPATVSWRWEQRDHLALPAPPPLAWAAACLVLMMGLACIAPSLRQRRGYPALVRPFAASLLAASAMLLLVTQRTVGAPGAAISLLLAWATLWLTLLYPRRASLLASSAVLLLGAGLLVQLEMGLGASDTAWLRHFQNTTALLGLGLPGALLLLSCFARGAVSRPVTERVLLVCAALALGGLLLQVCFGGETGVFDIQPFEFAKFALAALSAHCLALAAGGAAHERRDWRFWLRMAAPVLLFVFLLAAALVRVDDYSPLLLLLVWSGAMLLAWCASHGRRAALASVLVAAGLLAAGGVTMRAGGDLLGAFGFYPERFQVWSEPTIHPHTGQQMLQGSRAIVQGGWLGADQLLGLAALGGAAGEALSIPAIQDDFAPSFLLHRHGLAAGLALWSLQALFLAALLRAAAGAWRCSNEAKDFRRAWIGRFQCFALCGGAAFVAGHLLLSWGTNLAMFPIMGQPMSFLSAGGSHLLFFICPLLAFGMASTQFNEESQSCRSMSNTKS
jgi:cell division protein FtsW